jgi:hypothetical protein
MHPKALACAPPHPCTLPSPVSALGSFMALWALVCLPPQNLYASYTHTYLPHSCIPWDSFMFLKSFLWPLWLLYMPLLPKIHGRPPSPMCAPSSLIYTPWGSFIPPGAFLCLLGLYMCLGALVYAPSHPCAPSVLALFQSMRALLDTCRPSWIRMHPSWIFKSAFEA